MKLPIHHCYFGDHVKIGPYEFVIVDTNGRIGYTILLSAKSVKKMPFGEERDYGKSAIRDFCEKEFYKKLTEYLDEKWFEEFSKTLEAVNGSGADRFIRTKIAIPSIFQCAEWYKYLPEYEDWIWTSSPSTYNEYNYRNDIGCIGRDGIWYRSPYYQFNGIAPYIQVHGNAMVEKISES